MTRAEPAPLASCERSRQVCASRAARFAAADEWDQVALLRYRSRRDLLEMVAEPGMAEVSLHKWASVEKTQVFPVTPVISFIWIRSGVAITLTLAGVLLQVALRHREWYQPRA